MLHAKRTSGILVIVRKALGIKKFHDGGTGVGFHPDKGSETVPMDAH